MKRKESKQKLKQKNVEKRVRRELLIENKHEEFTEEISTSQCCLTFVPFNNSLSSLALNRTLLNKFTFR